MRYLKVIFVAVLCAVLWGCIQNDTVIHVRPDGSGFVEETVMVSNSIVESMQALGQAFTTEEKGANKDSKPSDQDPVQEMIKDARKKVHQFGSDVTFVSAAPVKAGEMTGYKAIYAFDDINKLKISQNPGDKVGKPEGGEGSLPKKEDTVLFAFRKGPVSTLTVTMPGDKKAAALDQKDVKEGVNKADSEAGKALGMLFKDMRVRIALKIEGAIVKTNATYRDGTLLTMLDLQFSKILENKAAFEKVSAMKPKTVEEMKDLVKHIEGLKVELNSPVVVEFR